MCVPITYEFHAHIDQYVRQKLWGLRAWKLPHAMVLKFLLNDFQMNTTKPFRRHVIVVIREMQWRCSWEPIKNKRMKKILKLKRAAHASIAPRASLMAIKVEKQTMYAIWFLYHWICKWSSSDKAKAAAR